MWLPPFQTKFERYKCITKMRELEGDITKIDGTLLNEKDKNTFDEKTRKLIKSLLQKDPSKRPSAKDLLVSDLVPARLEFNQPFLKQALQAVEDPRSSSRKKLLDAFFNVKVDPAIQLMYDDMHYTNLERKIDTDLNLEQYVKDIGGITRSSGEDRLDSEM